MRGLGILPGDARHHWHRDHWTTTAVREQLPPAAARRGPQQTLTACQFLADSHRKISHY
jgi:hypothetical protein